MAVSLAACGGTDTPYSQGDVDELQDQIDALQDQIDDINDQIDDAGVDDLDDLVGERDDLQAQIDEIVALLARTLDEDGETITVTGDDATIEVAGLTAAADTIAATVIAAGVAEITFNFADEDDLVVLDADSDLDGVETLNVVAGTVDLTAIDTAGLEVVTLASGVIMNISQIVSLISIILNSDEATVDVIIASAEDAELLRDLLEIFTGLDADSITLVASDDADEDLDIDAENDALTDAVIEAEVNDALVPQIEALISADDAVAEFLTEQISNDLLADQNLTDASSAADVRAAITAADTAADDAAAAAADAVTDAEDSLDVARATTFDGYNGAAQGAAATEQDVADMVAALESIDATTLMRDATLLAAVEEAQEGVDADAHEYLADGTNVADLAEVFEIEDDNGDPMFVTADYSAGVVYVYEFDSSYYNTWLTLGANTLANLTSNAEFYNAMYTGTLEIEVTYDDIDNPTTTTVTLTVYNGSVPTLQAGAVNDQGDADVIVGTSTELPGVADDAEVVGYAAQQDVSSGVVDAVNVLPPETFTASELQDAIADAVTALNEVIAEIGTEESVVEALRTAINAYLQGEGDPTADVDGQDGQETVLSLRNTIIETLDDETSTSANILQIIQDVADYDLALAGEAATDEEQAILDLIADAAALADAHAAVTDASAAFGQTVSGAIYNIAVALQVERAAQIDAIPAAEDALEAANQTAADTQALVDALAELDAAADDALEAIEDAVADGGLGINVEDGNAGTADDDLFIFTSDDGDRTITNFGADGTDRIFVVGDYDFVAIADDEEITDDLGSNDDLEIFWVQDGNDLKIYVETETFGGNASGTDDLATLTLSGVIGTVSFSDGVLTVEISVA